MCAEHGEGSVTVQGLGKRGRAAGAGRASEQFVSCLIMTFPVSSVAAPGSAPAVFCTSDSTWTGSCSPPAAFCAPEPDGTCSAGPSRLGPVRQ